MFFGSDTDGDDKPDEGMAYKVTYVLKPYVQPGKNIIAAKIDNEDNSIKIADDSIKRHEDHLKKYEEKLRTKFAAHGAGHLRDQLPEAVDEAADGRHVGRRQG